MSAGEIIPASFRDPSGFVFRMDDTLYRQVNHCYKDHYELLMNSGLYQALTDDGLLIRHDEVSLDCAQSARAYKVIVPEQIPFVSYPYEWCFSQLKDAALATLRVQKRAIEFGMTLKDSSVYNIQFLRSKPVLIDTLSFEEYREGQAWFGYGQFCRHFLAPLALMARRDVRLNQLLRIHLDGVPLDLAAELLPRRSRFNVGLLFHIHLHARSQRHFAGKTVNVSQRKVSKLGFVGLIQSLENAVKKLHWKPTGTEWGEYYDNTNYTDAAMTCKEQLVSQFLDRCQPETVWDMGANTGVFSRLACDRGAHTVAFDIDPAAVEQHYLQCRRNDSNNLLPLIIDLTNPSPGIGWQNRERDSLRDRSPVDAVLALALIHHLAISNNLPLAKIADFFAELCHWLIIEFVPKDDSQVQKLLATREDIFPQYTPEAFEKVFSQRFTIHDSAEITNTSRVLYLMEKTA